MANARKTDAALVKAEKQLEALESALDLLLDQTVPNAIGAVTGMIIKANTVIDKKINGEQSAKTN